MERAPAGALFFGLTAPGTEAVCDALAVQLDAERLGVADVDIARWETPDAENAP